MSTRIHTKNYNAVCALKSKIVHNLWFLIILLLPIYQTLARSITVADTTPPIFENTTPSISSITDKEFILSTDINEAGTIYYVVLTGGATAPTPAEVKVGTGSGGSGQITAASQTVSSGNFIHSFSITGLVANTVYDVYVVAEDVDLNLQTTVTKAVVLTKTTAPPANAVNLWGVDANINKDNAEFVNDFITSNLSNTTWAGLSKYTIVGDDIYTPGYSYWSRSLTGSSNGAYGAGTAVSSPSKANGVAIYDSDFIDNQGDVNYIGGTYGGTTPGKNKGELISPPINLSGYENKRLYVKFHQYQRNYQISDLSISFSTDNGVTWGNAVSFLLADNWAYYGTYPQGFVELALPENTTQGVADLSQCRLKFTFEGAYYFVMIDDVSIRTISNEWTGTTNTNWNTPTNWSANTVPTNNDNVIVNNVANLPIISNSSVAVSNLIINDNATVTVNGNSSLTINNSLEIKNNATLQVISKIPTAGTINSGSVILKGSYTEVTPNSFKYFTETYHNNDNGWSLVSSPTIGEVIDGGATGFAKFNKLQISTSNNYGIAAYDNSLTGNKWDYYTSAEISATNNIAMTSGKGYSILPNSTVAGQQNNGNIRFKGSVPCKSAFIYVTDKSGAGGNGFNLLGNPYPAYIPANTNANNDNILSFNTKSLAEETLWLWDKATASYITVNQSSPSRFIAPTQGFFVKIKTSNYNFEFTERMRSHQTNGVYNKNNNTRSEIKITATQDGVLKSTDIYYINGTTTGFDNGYDSSVFSGVKSSFAVYTGLVNNSQNKKLAIQSLPDNSFENMIIPVGLKATANKAVSFKINAVNLPSEIKVYLEDRERGTFTNISEENYTVTFNTNVNGLGRFYLHTSSKALSTSKTNITTELAVFKTGNQLLIKRLNSKGNVQLFNSIGKQVLKTSVDAKESNTIELPKLAKGVYIVRINSAKGTLSKKIMVD